MYNPHNYCIEIESNEITRGSMIRQMQSNKPKDKRKRQATG